MPATSAWVKAAFVFFSLALTDCTMPGAVSRTSRCAGESQKFFKGLFSIPTSLMRPRDLLTSSAILGVLPKTSLIVAASSAFCFFGVFIVHSLLSLLLFLFRLSYQYDPYACGSVAFMSGMPVRKTASAW